MTARTGKNSRSIAIMGLRYAGTLPLLAVFPLFGIAKVCGADIGIEFLACAGSVSVFAVAVAYGRRTRRFLPSFGRSTRAER